MMNPDHHHHAHEFKVYTKRWWILAMFCFLNLSNAMLWVTFAPISDITNDYFGGIGITSVNMLAIIYQVIYGPGTLLAVLVMKKYGMRRTMLIGGSLSFLGAVIRLVGTLFSDSLGNYGTYSLVMIGQICGALAQPFYVNLPSGIAAAWFHLDERDAATTIGSLFNPLGNAVGQVLPAMLVTQSDSGKIEGMNLLMGVEAGVCAMSFLIAYVFFTNKPLTPPSHSAAVKDSLIKNEHIRHNSTERAKSNHSLIDDNEEYLSKAKEEFNQLMGNRDFMLLLVSFSVGLGIFNGFLTLIFQIVEPHGYSNDDAGTFAAVLIVCGLMGAGMAGVLMDATHYYRTILKVSFVGCLFGMTFFFCMLYSDNFGLLCFSFGLLGFWILPILPAILENCAECTFPIAEELSVGLLFIGGNVVGIPIIFILQWLLEVPAWGPPPFLPSNVFIAVLLVFCLLVLLPYNGQYLRMQCEEEDDEDEGGVGYGDVKVLLDDHTDTPLS